MRSLMSVHVLDSSLLSPALGTTSHSTAVFLSRNGIFQPRHCLKPGTGLSRTSKRKFVASTRPAPRVHSSWSGRYDNAPGQHTCGGASQPSLPHTQGSNEITPLEKTPSICSVGKDRRGGGRGMITTCFRNYDHWWISNIILIPIAAL